MQEKIERNGLVEEIETALKDMFVAEIAKNENVLTIAFLNGQKFSVTIDEVM